MVLESQIQKRIIKYLRNSGWIVLKVIRCNLNGFPDLTAFKDGETIFIEVKKPGEKAKPLQEYRHLKLEGAGFKVYTVDSLEQLNLKRRKNDENR